MVLLCKTNKKIGMYSIHIRKKILLIKDEEKLSFVKVAKRFGMSPNTIYNGQKE